MLDQQIGHRLAADFAAVEFLDTAAHRPQHCDQPGAGRVEADVFDSEFAARHQQRGDQEKGGRRRIAGDFDGLGVQFRLAADTDGARALRCNFDGQLGAESAEHPFGMIARRHGLDDSGDPGGVEPGQQDGALHLGRGDRQAIFDRHCRRSTAQHQRQSSPGRGAEIRAHQAERLDHPAHRPLRQAGIANESRGDRMRGDQTHQQTGRSAAVAHVERLRGLQQPADTDAMYLPFACTHAFDMRPHRPHGCSCGQHILALEQPGNPAFAHGQRREHQRAVADRLVAGDANAPAQRPGGHEAAGAGQ